MDHDERAVAQELHAEIAIADCINAVAGDAVKTQLMSYSLAINWKRCAGECRGTQRQDVDSRASLGKSIAISGKHFKVSKTPVRKENGLCSLKMRVPRKNCTRFRLSEIQQGFLRWPHLP